MKKQRFHSSLKFKRYLKSFSLVFISNTVAFSAIGANRTATISSGSQQLTGAYELSNSSQSQATVKITGNNTTVTAGDDVSISVTGQGNAISLTNGSLILDGTSIQGSNNSTFSSYMVSNTNGNLNVSNISLTTDTIKSSGIVTNGSSSVTNIKDSHLIGGYTTVEGKNGATVTVNGSQIDSIGNYGIIVTNNANLTGANNIINMDGGVYSQAGIYASSNIANTQSSVTLDNTQLYVKNGISGIQAEAGGKITLNDLAVRGNVNSAVRATGNGSIEIQDGTIILDQGAIALAKGTSEQAIATIELNNVTAESSGNQNYYENDKNYALINSKAFSNIIVEGGSYHSKGVEQHGVWAVNDTATISINNSRVSTDMDKSVGIKSNGNVLVNNTSVTTAGINANALYSEALITAKQLTITTTGNSSSAIATNKTGQIGISDSIVKTTGSNASIFEATNNSTINAQNITATTSGDNSHGILAKRSGYYDQQSYVTVSDSSVNVSGNQAAGIAAINQYNSTIDNQYVSDITLHNTSVTSENGDGLYVKGMDANVKLTDGSSLAANNGRLIYAEALSFTNNDIASNVNLVAESNSQLVGSVDFQKGSTVNMQLTGANWKMLSSSNVTNLSNLNDSVIDLTNSNSTQYNILNITGNYTGDIYKNQNTNGRLIVNTLWNNDSSSSDKLNIAGTATGYTQVQTHHGIIGDVTQDDELGKYSADVITVGDHTMGSNSFYGFADTAGAGQALLVQKDANTYAWYIPKVSPVPDKPVGPTPIKPEVPGFTVMPDANMNLGYQLIGTLHQRVSEQQSTALDNKDPTEGQVWGRFLGSYTRNNGENRFNYRSNMWGAQLGYDFAIKYNPEDGSSTHTGVMLTYAKDDIKFHDDQYVSFNQLIGQYQASNKKTGSGQTDWVSLGGYYTYYDKNNSYLDLVGHFNYAHNKYDSIRSDKSSNNALGTTLSAEVGHPFKILTSHWLIEPQVQIIYQYLHFSDFKTLNNIKVDQDDRHGLRGRLGFRLGYNKDTQAQSMSSVYLTGNIYHDFINSTNSTKIGNSHIKEKFVNTWGEAGIGAQLPITNNAAIYTDIRYSHSLSSHRGTREGVNGNIGFKYQW